MLPFQSYFINSWCFILNRSRWFVEVPKGFVSKSTSYSLEVTWFVSTKPFGTWLRTMWQLMSRCFVLSWKTGFAAIYSAALLSQFNVTGDQCRPKEDAEAHERFVGYRTRCPVWIIKSLNFKVILSRKKMPCSEYCFRYLTTYSAALRCGHLGYCINWLRCWVEYRAWWN